MDFWEQRNGALVQALLSIARHGNITLGLENGEQLLGRSSHLRCLCYLFSLFSFAL
jgi:hypothetical protein